MSEDRPYSEIFEKRVDELKDKGFSYTGKRVPLSDNELKCKGLLRTIEDLTKPVWHPDQKQEIVILETPRSTRQKPE